MKAVSLFVGALIILSSTSFIEPNFISDRVAGLTKFNQINFEEGYVKVLNNSMVTTVLIIVTVGTPFFGNLSFSCPKEFECPVRTINDIFFSPGVEVRENFTFVPHLNGTLISHNEFISASLKNDTLMIENRADLWVETYFPLSFEITNSWANCIITNNYGGFDETYMCQGYRPDKRNLTVDVTITNHDLNIPLKGFFGCNGFYVYPGSAFPFTFFNDTAFNISPGSSIKFTLLIPKPIGEEWSWTVIDEIIFKYNKNSSPLVLPNLDLKKATIEIIELYMRTRMFSNIGFWLDTPSEVQDIWNGTNVTIHVYNAMDSPLVSEYVIIEDSVDLYTSFKNEQYKNITTVQMGDIGPSSEKQINCTIFSKASGKHKIKATLGSDRKITTDGSANDITIASGMGVTYIGKDEGLTLIPARRIEINEVTNISMLIDNPLGYKGDVSLSIHVAGWRGELEKMNGNGWLDESRFVDIEPKSVRINSPKENVTFKIRPKVSGQLYLIPYIIVKGRLLLIDENTANQNWSDPCSQGSNVGMHPALPGICAGYSYEHTLTYIYKGIKQLNILVNSCCVVCIVITILAYIRRYNLQAKYKKIIERRAAEKTQPKSPKKRPKKAN